MVALTNVEASNSRLAETYPQGLVAVFVGGTSGVGEFTVKTFAKYAQNSRVYIVGRSRESAESIITECKSMNTSNNFEFLEADVSQIKAVDNACRIIKEREPSINVLFQSQGTMNFKAKTADGLPLSSTLFLHSRIRFILNLLPLLQASNTLRRVVSVGAATFEGPIDTTNIPGVGFCMPKSRGQMASCMTLLLERIARRAPGVGFVHDVPGVIQSKITRDATGIFLHCLIAVSKVLGSLLYTPPIECGEMHLFYCTSARFAPAQSQLASRGVPLSEPVTVARSIAGKAGGGMYSVDTKGESAPPAVEKLIQDFQDNGTADKVWDFLFSDFKRITGTEKMA